MPKSETPNLLDPAPELFEKAADAIINGDLVGLRALLDVYPSLVTAQSQRPHKATLLHYIGANGVEEERQRSPHNAGAIAELLIERGAAPDALDANAYTPLLLAVTSDFTRGPGAAESIVGALVRGGAKVDGVGDDGVGDNGAPLDRAIHYGHATAVRALVSAGARTSGVSAAAAIGQLDLVKDFVAASSATPTNGEMEQALINAACFGYPEVVEFLLDRGVAPGAKDHQSFTPLHWAAGNGHLDVVRSLLSRGAPLEAKNAFGGTVLDFTGWQAKNSTGDVDHLPIVELLIAAGADVEAAYPSGNARVDEVLSGHRARR